MTKSKGATQQPESPLAPQASGMLPTRRPPLPRQSGVREAPGARLANVLELPRLAVSNYDEHRPLLWIEGVDLPSGEDGAASMGALRAAELHDFGMLGVGEIFEAYRSGRLQDDDEVAVAHAERDTGYRRLSESMVNIRATLEAARREGLLDAQPHQCLVDCAKSRFYPERSCPALLADARKRVGSRALDGFQAWLERGAVDQKRLDALALLKVIGKPPGARRPGFVFQHTDAWQQLVDTEEGRAEGGR